MIHSANICLFKVDNINTRKRREIYSKLTINALGLRQCRRSSVFIDNFEHILHLLLVFLSLNLNRESDLSCIELGFFGLLKKLKYSLVFIYYSQKVY